MNVRKQLGQQLERTLGKERTDRIRLLEGKYRLKRDTRRWIPSDPFVPHHEAAMERHDLLRDLHCLLSPRTYLEIGVDKGESLTCQEPRPSVSTLTSRCVSR